MPDAIRCRGVTVTRMSRRQAGRQNYAANEVTDSLHFQGLIVRPAQNSQGSTHSRSREPTFSQSETVRRGQIPRYSAVAPRRHDPVRAENISAFSLIEKLRVDVGGKGEQ